MPYQCRVPINAEEAGTPPICLITGETEGVSFVPYRAETSALGFGLRGMSSTHERLDMRIPLSPAAHKRMRVFRFLRVIYMWSILWVPAIGFGAYKLSPGLGRELERFMRQQLGMEAFFLILIVPVVWIVGYGIVELLIKPRCQPMCTSIGMDSVALTIPSAEAASALGEQIAKERAARTARATPTAEPTELPTAPSPSAGEPKGVAPARDPGAVATLIALSRGSDPEASNNAEDALHELGAAAIEPLIELVRNGSTEDAEAAMGVLGDMQEAHTEPARKAILERMLSDDHVDPLLAGCQLKDLGAEEAFAMLVAVLEAPDQDTRIDVFTPRERAASALAFNEPARAVPHLARAIAAYTDPDGISSEIESSLALTDDPSARAPLLELVAHECDRVRLAVAQALTAPALRGGEGVPAALEQLRGDENPDVREKASA